VFEILRRLIELLGLDEDVSFLFWLVVAVGAHGYGPMANFLSVVPTALLRLVPNWDFKPRALALEKACEGDTLDIFC